MSLTRTCLAAAALILATGCGDGATPNTTRAGYVSLTPDEAWILVQHELEDTDGYQVCSALNDPCNGRSAYLRDRDKLYWFILHETDTECVRGQLCAPDRFRYVEVTGNGAISEIGSASVQYDLDGWALLVSGDIFWGVPDLEARRPVLYQGDNF